MLASIPRRCATFDKVLPLSAFIARKRGTYEAQRARKISVPAPGVLKIEYPTANEAIRERYSLFGTAELRVGHLLEDMDMLAGDAIFRHALIEPGGLDETKITMATACVDALTLPRHLTLDGRLALTAAVTNVGSTSAEISIDVETDSGTLGTARFVFVLLNKVDLRPAKAFKLPPSVNQCDEGAARAQLRKELFRRAAAPPSPEETAEMFETWVSALKVQDPSWMAETEVQTTVLAHSQDLNRNGTVFGGHVMKLALETAYMAASRRARARVHTVGLSEVNFIHPVPAGQPMHVRSKVCKVDRESGRFYVDSLVYTMSHADKHVVVSCSFEFIADSGAQLEDVVPRSFSDYLARARTKRRIETWQRAGG